MQYVLVRFYPTASAIPSAATTAAVSRSAEPGTGACRPCCGGPLSSFLLQQAIVFESGREGVSLNTREGFVRCLTSLARHRCLAQQPDAQRVSICAAGSAVLCAAINLAQTPLCPHSLLLRPHHRCVHGGQGHTVAASVLFNDVLHMQ